MATSGLRATPFRLVIAAGVSAACLPVAAASAQEAGDPPASATSAVTRSFTLPEAIAYARAHEPELQAARARLDAVKADASVTRARWYPSLTGTAQIVGATANNSTGTYLPISSFDNPRVSSTPAVSAASASLAPAVTTLLGAGARQQVCDFGRITAQAAADDLRADAARYSTEATRLLVEDEVEESFYAVSTAKSILDVATNAYARAAVHRDLAKVGVTSGLRRPIELTRAEAVLDRYDLDRVRGRRGVAVAESVFAAAVGVPEALLDISGDPPVPADLPALGSALATALAANPELQAAVALVRAQQKQTSAVEAEMRPSLYLSSAVSVNSGGAAPSSGSPLFARGLLPMVPNWDVGLVLAWPMYDATTRARAHRARLEEVARQADVAVVRRRLVAVVERAYLDLAAAREALPVLRHALAAAVANYDQANARFEVGLGNSVELADAEDLRSTAEIDLALGTFEVARARAALGRAIAEHL
jgi:outer membrane protein